jgi:hypothetical protein
LQRTSEKQMKHWEHMLATTIATSRSTFATSIRITCNIPLKHLKHFKHTLATYVFSATSTCCLDDWRLVGVELDGDAELDATGGAQLWWRRPLRWRRRPVLCRTSRWADGPVERKDGGRRPWSVVERRDGGRSGAVESAAAAWSRWSTCVTVQV